MNNPELEMSEELWIPLLAREDEYLKLLKHLSPMDWFDKAFVQHYDGCEAPRNKLKAFKHKLRFENPEDEKGVLYRICKTCEKVTGMSSLTEQGAETLLKRLEEVTERNLIKQGRQEMKDEIVELGNLIQASNTEICKKLDQMITRST